MMIPSRLATLGHPSRFALFRLLMRRYPDRVPAGELAAALDLRPSTLSAYLSALMQAGLVTQERSGASLRYRVEIETLRGTLDYLLSECCRGRPDICAPGHPAAPATRPDARRSVLFLCTGNSARSIFAEAILRAEAGGRFDVRSAGTQPRAAVHPAALRLLRDKGHDVAGLRPKDMEIFRGADAPHFDFIFTVCDRAANEDCPAWPGQPISAHWGVCDPVAATGSAAEKARAFHHAYGALERRIRAFAALPLAALDRIALQRAVDDIAEHRQGDAA